MTPNGSPGQPETRVGGASSGVRSFIYTGGLWGLGLMLVRVLPVWLTKGLCVMVGEIHFRVQRQRRQVVIENLLPADEKPRKEMVSPLAEDGKH